MEVAAWVDETLPRSHRYKMLDTSLWAAGLGGPRGPQKNTVYCHSFCLTPELESKALLLKALTLWVDTMVDHTLWVQNVEKSSWNSPCRSVFSVLEVVRQAFREKGHRVFWAVNPERDSCATDLSSQMCSVVQQWHSCHATPNCFLIGFEVCYAGGKPHLVL